jgi:hypothetical protein
VYVTSDDGNTWNETLKLVASDGTAGGNFGYDVSVNSGVVAVGTAAGTRFEIMFSNVLIKICVPPVLLCLCFIAFVL